jgi:hypothetical protein
MFNWLIHHGVWRGDIHWLGDLAGLCVAGFLIWFADEEDRRLVAAACFMLGGYSSIPDIVRTNDGVVAGYHLFWLLLAVIATPTFFRELLPAARWWWGAVVLAWHGEWGKTREARRRLREAQAARKAAEARLARAKTGLAEAIKLAEEIKQAEQDHAAGKPFYLMGRVYGHEEVKE